MNEIKKDLQNIDKIDYLILTVIYTAAIISTIFLISVE